MKKTLINSVAFTIIFIAPIIVILMRYEKEKTVTVESGLPLFASISIAGILLVIAMLFVASVKGKIINEPFGRMAILAYTAVLSLFVMIGYIMLSWVINAIEVNMLVFIDNMQYHINTLKIMLIFIASGAALLLFEYPMKLLSLLNK